MHAFVSQVILKLDIDGGPELEIAEAIGARSDLQALVDEIFFEYHFWFDDLDFGWGNQRNVRRQVGVVDDALRLMLKLRNSGVRSHFWI